MNLELHKSTQCDGRWVIRIRELFDIGSYNHILDVLGFSPVFAITVGSEILSELSGGSETLSSKLPQTLRSTQDSTHCRYSSSDDYHAS